MATTLKGSSRPARSCAPSEDGPAPLAARAPRRMSSSISPTLEASVKGYSVFGLLSGRAVLLDALDPQSKRAKLGFEIPDALQ
jgi:hypothetical protein